MFFGCPAGNSAAPAVRETAVERSRLTGLLCTAALTLPLLAHADALTRPGAEDSACRPAIPLPTADAPDRRIAITPVSYTHLTLPTNREV